jgi:hypothetical protein
MILFTHQLGVAETRQPSGGHQSPQGRWIRARGLFQPASLHPLRVNRRGSLIDRVRRYLSSGDKVRVQRQPSGGT